MASVRKGFEKGERQAREDGEDNPCNADYIGVHGEKEGGMVVAVVKKKKKSSNGQR